MTSSTLPQQAAGADQQKPASKRAATSSENESSKKIKQVNQIHRQLREQLDANAEELMDPNSRAVETIVSKIDQAFKEASTVKHLVVDSELMLDVSQAVLAQVAKIGKAHAPITMGNFKSQLRSLFGENVHWVQLGRELRVYGTSIPSYDVMLGPVEVVPPPKKERVVAPKVAKEKFDLEKPVDMASAASKAANEAKAADGFEVLKHLEKEIRTHLKERADRELDFCELLFNPESFAQTVENIFAFSFIIKDGLAALRLGKDGTPKAQSASSRDPSKPETQAILAFSMADWQRLCDEYQLKNKPSVIKHRTKGYD